LQVEACAAIHQQENDTAMHVRVCHFTRTSKVKRRAIGIVFEKSRLAGKADNKNVSCYDC
jgi:hypothetical protein